MGARRPMPFLFSPHARVAADALPAGSDLRDSVSVDVARVIDQGPTGVCFAAAPARALVYSFAATGTPLGFDPSVLDLATLVHALERAADGDPEHDKLWDWGGDPADVVTVCQSIGVRPARYRPGTDEAVRRCDASPDTIGPPWSPAEGQPGGVEIAFSDLLRDAHGLLVGVHEIGVITDPELDLRRSIAGGAAVTGAWCVQDADEDPAPDTVLDARVGIADHDSLFVAYRTMPDGSFQYLLQNSWGDHWGDDGRLWVTGGFVRSATCLYSFSARRAA